MVPARKRNTGSLTRSDRPSEYHQAKSAQHMCSDGNAISGARYSRRFGQEPCQLLNRKGIEWESRTQEIDGAASWDQIVEHKTKRPGDKKRQKCSQCEASVPKQLPAVDKHKNEGQGVVKRNCGRCRESERERRMISPTLQLSWAPRL